MSLFILRWNPNISSFTKEDYSEVVTRVYEADQYPIGLNWSLKDWKKASKGDIFILQQVGTDNDGFVMIGKFASDPYKSNSWRKDGTKIYYADLILFTVFDRINKKTMSAEEYEKLFDFTEWHSGHSGEYIEDEKAEKILKKISEDLQKEMLWDITALDRFKNKFFVAIPPMEQKQFVESFIKDFEKLKPKVHKNKETDFSWLSDGKYSIQIETPVGDDMFVDVAEELSLFYAGGHIHFCYTDIEYLKKILNLIIENKACIISICSGEKELIASVLKIKDDYTLEKKEEIMDALNFMNKKDLEKVKSQHGTIEVTYWDKEKSFTIEP